MKRFNLRIFILFLLLATIASVCKNCLSAQEVKKSPLIAVTNVFKPGETIKFGIYSSLIRVGSGILTYHGLAELDSRKAQKITMQVSTFSLLDKETVYSIDDFSQPIKVERYVRFMGKTEDIGETYTESAKKLEIQKTVNNKKNDPQTFSTGESFSNVLALIYKFRNDASMAKDKVYKIVLPTQTVDFVVKEDAKKIKVPLGLFKAYYIESIPPKFKIWLSADERRIPLRIQGLVSIGSVYMAATGISQ